jgi:hypothetical protein
MGLVGGAVPGNGHSTEVSSEVTIPKMLHESQHLGICHHWTFCVGTQNDINMS